MTRHLTDEQLMDLLENEAESSGRGHAGECAACSVRLDGLRDTLRTARGAEVPEPSPLYWEAFRRNLDRRLAEEPRAPRRASWFLPLLATAALVAIVVALPRRGGGPAGPGAVASPAAVLAAWSPLPPAEEDTALPALEGFVVADGGATAWDEGRGLGAFEAGLSEEEWQALAERLGQSKGGEL